MLKNIEVRLRAFKEGSANKMVNELYHYGVRGMKWGVRRYQNPDGSLTAAGRKKLSKSVRDTYHKNSKGQSGNYGAAAKTINSDYQLKSRLQNATEVVNARKKLKEANKAAEEYYYNKDVKKKYILKAADKAAKENNGDKEFYRNWYLYDDGDQGSNNSFQLYLKDKGINAKDYAIKVSNANKEYETACRKAVDNLLGEYGNTPLKATAASSRDRTVKEVLANTLDDITYDEMPQRYSYYMLD